MFICFLYLSVSIQVSDVYVNVLSIIVFFSLNFSFLVDTTVNKIKRNKNAKHTVLCTVLWYGIMSWGV